MSLPTPIDVISRIRKGIAGFFFAVAVLLVVVPTIQWALMFLGVVAVMIGRHWALGIVLFALGFGGKVIGKNIRI